MRAALSLFPEPLLLVPTFISFILTQCEFIHPMALTTTHTLCPTDSMVTALKSDCHFLAA